MNFKRSGLSGSCFAKSTGAVLTAASLMIQAVSAAPVAPEQPNILFIFSDDHATQAISAYNDTYINTPNIDRIASEGAVFEDTFVGNSICQPSRATVLTGKHTHLNGVIDNTSPWNGNQTIFPRLLAANGYNTALIGKWHLEPTPTTEFDYSTVLLGHGRQGTYYNPEFIDNKGKKYRVEGYSTDVITDKAIDWLDNDRDMDKPFSLMVQFKAPHTPRRPPARNMAKFKDHVFPEPETLHDDYGTRGEHAANAWMQIYGMNDVGINAFPPAPDTPEKAKIHKAWLETMQPNARRNYDEWMNRMTEEQRVAFHEAYDDINIDYWKKIQSPPYKRQFGKDVPPEDKKIRTSYMYQRFMRDYMATVATIDENVGRLLEWLDDNDMAENTIVVYSSDQSFFIGEHGWAEKRYMYEEGMRMPFIIRWPAEIKPNQRLKAMIQNIDFAPTFLTMTGTEVPEEMQGISFADLLEGNMTDAQWQENRPSVYYHYYMQGGHNVPRHDGVRSERYKLINFYSGAGSFELYDLENDPNEVNNVYDNPEYEEIRKDMMAQLIKLREDYEVPESDFVAPYPYMNRRERKELGYL